MMKRHGQKTAAATCSTAVNSEMPMRSCDSRVISARFVLTALFAAAVMAGQPARAGLFDDDEARRQVKDLSIQTNERVDTLSKAQIELANQIQALREENAALRGEIETLAYELNATKKRQQDFYVDLDTRLRKFEGTGEGDSAEAGASPGAEAQDALGALSGASASGGRAKVPASDPVAESREYEAALNLFRANKVKEAASAFEAFDKKYPDSSLAPSARYWLGNAYYTLRNCRKAIEVHKQVAAKWPKHAKAPDSLLGVATCQQELGDTKGAKATLESVIAKYPGSAAAGTARQSLKK